MQTVSVLVCLTGSSAVLVTYGSDERVTFVKQELAGSDLAFTKLSMSEEQAELLSKDAVAFADYFRRVV